MEVIIFGTSKRAIMMRKIGIVQFKVTLGVQSEALRQRQSFALNSNILTPIGVRGFL